MTAPSDVAQKVPIGRPIAHSTAYVLDGDRNPLPAGAVGELYVGGDGVARGYLNLPELTASRFVPDPFLKQADARMYRTGDLARYTDAGELEFIGRSDDQLKIRGHRVELLDVEVTLARHTGVREAAVVAVEIAGEKTLAAAVAPAPGSQLDERAIRSFLAGALPTFMLPSRISIVSSLPKHPSGKIDRAAVARSFAKAAPAPVPRPVLLKDTRTSDVRERIGAIWCELIGLERTPGIDENFFDAGGDSLRLLRMQSRLRSEFNVDIAATELFESATIRALGARILAVPVSA
jgi:acyl-coenzyme A synthetase/AMP-(fatty) acid ligase/acyl carrier protein